MKNQLTVVRTLSKKRNPVGATVQLAEYRNRLVVTKSFETNNRFLKPIARYLANREASILKDLQQLGSVPAYFGMLNSYTFAMEYIAGSHPLESEQNIGKDALNTAEQFLNEFHNKGLIYNDLRGKNTIISTDGRLVFIDFGATLRTQCHRKPYRHLLLPWCRLVNRLKRADRYNFIRLKMRFAPATVSGVEKITLQTGAPFKAISSTWKLLFR